MRKFTRMLTCLLALVVAVGLCVPALAVNADESPLYLSATPDAPALGYEVTVQIGAKEDGLVADGKLIVTYDPAVLRYVGASLGQAWDHHPDVTMADNDQNGKVIIAFAGIDAAKAGCLVELTFVCKKIGTATVSLDGSSTLTGFTGTDLSDKVSFQVRESELLSVTFREDPSGKRKSTCPMATPPRLPRHPRVGAATSWAGTGISLASRRIWMCSLCTATAATAPWLGLLTVTPAAITMRVWTTYWKRA